MCVCRVYVVGSFNRLSAVFIVSLAAGGSGDGDGGGVCVCSSNKLCWGELLR